MDWKELIVFEIEKAKQRIVSLNLEKGMVRYSERIRLDRPIHRISEDSEIVRAYMVHRFVNTMGYAPESLELDRPYKVGNIRETVTVDVVVNDEDGDPFFFAIAVAPDDYVRGEGAESRLFLAAEKEFEKTGRVVHHLLYFTVKVENEKLAHESMIIDYSHFHLMSDWDRKEDGSHTVIGIKGNMIRERFRGNRKIVRIRYRDSRITAFFDRK
ncbi:MAG: hypothetical protein CO090_08085 [Acidobacteria bacterium CG_4_9_14_3_um_filter_49_7]|nr:MAG: hypothetical protein CO090_08085 [Acidobacteria bacterium CG_4_9_14_3_um_filter_49_7]